MDLEARGPSASEDPSELVRRLLRLQCIFLIEKEVDSLKNRQLLKEIDEYTRQAQKIDLQQIILILVKCFIDKYFDEVKRHIVLVLKNVPRALSSQEWDAAGGILEKCLITLEKRMFKNLYDRLNDEPLYFLMMFNIFDLENVKKEERYRVAPEINPRDIHNSFCFSDENSAKIKSINIFELIKYVYYNAVIGAKAAISKSIFKRFLEDNAARDMERGMYDTDPCKKYMKRGGRLRDADTAERSRNYKNLRVVEYLIKEFWKNLPDLKNEIIISKDDFSLQLSRLMANEQDDGEKYDGRSQEEEEEEKIDWNYLVTVDGETVYLNAPTYKISGEFHPVLARAPKIKEIKDRPEKSTRPSKEKAKCPTKLDAFDMKMDAILRGGGGVQAKGLVGVEMGPYKGLSRRDRVLSYLKAMRKYKRKQQVQSELWKMFNKTYFTFEEPEEEDTEGNQRSIRPNELYDFIPKYIRGTVQPIRFEFPGFRYLCAACGLFIDKGTGVEALGYKWHDQHFKCRICGDKFKEPSAFLLYRGIVLCPYDSKTMFGNIIEVEDVCADSQKKNRK